MGFKPTWGFVTAAVGADALFWVAIEENTGESNIVFFGGADNSFSVGSDYLTHFIEDGFIATGFMAGALTFNYVVGV